MFLNINLLSRHIGAAALYVLLNLFLAPGASANDGGTLKGVVSDKNGPLVGVAVYVKDTNNGVSSDIDGNYLLAGLEEGDVIVFSLLGFDTVEITWTGQALQDVLLDASADFLDEVVVVGYGVQKKVNLTGSVSTVDSDELDMRPVANITQSLQGLVPGLTVNNTNSGRPGAEATLQIRGQGNLSGTSTPYVLVDGVEMDLADVNPNDVESISVLKDASASAIYGARAAYGVILVTTKSGEKGKIRVSYNGNAGWTQPTVLPDMANSVEYANYWNAAATNAGSSRLYSAEKIKAALKPLRDRVGMPEVDFDREYNTSDDYPFKDLDKYIQAVRRERRVEKAFEAERKYDIFRWAAADVLIKGWVPTGALFDGSDLEGNSFYTDEDGNSSLVYDQSEGNNLFLTDADENGDRYVVPFDWKSSLPSGYQFNLGRDYLLPIRSGMISLTGNLWEQNPGW